SHTGNLTETVVNPAEQLLHLFGLERAECGIDRQEITALGLEAEVLVFEIAQALRQQRSGREQYQRHCRLYDDQGFLRPRTIASDGTVRSAQGFNRVGVWSDP